MKIRMSRAAREELVEAIGYYNSEKSDLGWDFLEEFAVSVEAIRRWPEAWPQFSRRARRYRMDRFPYGVMYQIANDQIFIQVVAHLSRSPSFWRKRVR